jgi:oligosaccharyltransferase complex subunit alpha (ribophorin I)
VQSARYIFNYSFVPDFDEFLAENYTLKVILPEGATNIKFHLPFSVDSVENGLHFSTLDYIGRPSITITKNNVHKLIHNEAF